MKITFRMYMMLCVCIAIPLCGLAWMGPEPLASTAMAWVLRISGWMLLLILALMILRIFMTLVYGFRE